MVEVLTAESSVLVKLVTVTVTEDPNLVCVDTNTCLSRSTSILSNCYPHLHGLLHGGPRGDDGLLQLDDLVEAVHEGVEAGRGAGGRHLLLAAAQYRTVARAPAINYWSMI